MTAIDQGMRLRAPDAEARETAGVEDPDAHHGSDAAHEHVRPSRRLMSLLALERESLWVVLVHTAGIGIVSLAAPLGVQALVNAIAFGGLRQPLVILGLMVLVGLVFAGVLRALLWSVTERMQQRIFVRTALDAARRLPHLQVTRGAEGAELVNRFFDVTTVQKGTSLLLIEGLNLTLKMVLGAVVLAFYHPTLLAFAVCLVVAIAGSIFGLASRGTDTAIEESKTKYRLVAWFEEVARHAVSFRSAEGEAFAVSRSARLTEDYLEARRAHFRVVFRQGVAIFAIQALALSVLLVVGGLLVLEGAISLGQLVAAELIVASVLGALYRFAKYLEGHYDLLAALDKVGHLLDHPAAERPALPSGVVAHDINTANTPLIALHEVSFVVPRDRDRELLCDVSLELRVGERVAVLGADGSGKSTLLELAWGLSSPASGRIEIGGVPIRALELQHVRSQVVLVRADELFDGTIDENVRVGRDTISIQTVREALETVGLWDTVASLPEGLSTRLALARMSAGEGRRLLLARAIVGQPTALLVDGLLDGMDAASRKIVVEGVFRPEAPWAVLLTTHDPTVAALFPRTLVLTQGALIPSETRVEAPRRQES